MNGPLGPHLKAWDGRNGDDHLRRVDGRNDIVVRIVPEPLGRFEHLRRWVRLVREVQTRHGLSVPPLITVAGQGPDGTPVGYILCKRIHGQRLDEALSSHQAPPLSEVDDLYRSLISYYRSTFERGGDYLVDMRNEQFVFGKLGAGEERIWWVALDPIFVTFDPNSWEEVNRARIHWRIADLANMVIEAETFGALAPRVREDLLKFLRTVAVRESAAGKERMDLIRRGLTDATKVQGRWWVQQALDKSRRP